MPSSSSTHIVQQGQASAYPDGLRRLPQLLERIDSVRFELTEIGVQALELEDAAERLEQELSRLAQYVQTKVEVNRTRERRRVRRRRNGHSDDGHVPAVSLNGGNTHELPF